MVTVYKLISRTVIDITLKWNDGHNRGENEKSYNNLDLH